MSDHKNDEVINSEIDSDVTVVSAENNAEALTESSCETEQITKNVATRINMPRGTVKALMFCLAVLLLVAVILAFGGLDSKNDTKSVDTAGTESSREYGSEVPTDAGESWQEQQKEEAMNSLVEDAMRDEYEPEPIQDPLYD